MAWNSEGFAFPDASMPVPQTESSLPPGEQGFGSSSFVVHGQQGYQPHQQHSGQKNHSKGGNGINFNKFNNQNHGYAAYSNGGHGQGNNHGYNNQAQGYGGNHQGFGNQNQGYGGQGHGGAGNRSYERRRDARLTAEELCVLSDEQFVEIAKDKWKSRSLQRSLMEADEEVVRLIHQKAEPIFDQLLSDQYGNYLSQKILEFCTDDQYDELFKKVANRLHHLANEVSYS